MIDEAITVRHNFAGGTYAKRVDMAAGCKIKKHQHSYDHLSILARGSIELTAGGKTTWHSAPDELMIKAGIDHEIKAMSDCTWYCIHATEETDPDSVDRVLIEKGN
jgi:quercetin dioxygenase-like cupin family protein